MTQKALILNYIKEFGSISPMQAFSDLGITKLATRISELKDEGIKFITRVEKSKNRYGKSTRYFRYYLAKKFAIAYETCFSEDYPETQGILTVEAIDKKDAEAHFDVFHAIITDIEEIKE